MTVLAAFAAAFFHRRVIFGFAAARAALLSAVPHFIDRRPRSALSFLIGNSSVLIAFFNVFGHALLFVCVTALIASRHNFYLPLIRMFAFFKACARLWRFVRTGLKMSPFFLIRASMFLIVKSAIVMFPFSTSFQSRGAETVAPFRGLTEYGATTDLPYEFCIWST